MELVPQSLNCSFVHHFFVKFSDTLPMSANLTVGGQWTR